MEDQSLIAELPLSIWALILNLSHRTWASSHNKATLKQIFRCKITCKKLNQLLDDEFWFSVLVKRGYDGHLYRKIFMRMRIEYIIKINDIVRLEQFRNMAIKYKQEHGFNTRLVASLPHAVQHADLSFLKTAYHQMRLYDTLSHDMRFKCLKYAYELEDKEKVAFLLPLYLVNQQVKFANSTKVVDALERDEELDYSALPRLIEIMLLQFDEQQLNEKIEQLFGERKFQKQAVIISEGEFPNLEILSQNYSFNHQSTNFTIRAKKGNDNQMSLIYREKNGTIHETNIDTKTDQSGDSNVTTYCYEVIETKNINELILRTSLAERMFASYPQQFIAVTKELAELPYEQQPWFRGILTESARQALAADAPNNTTFFTYSAYNEVWLSFTTSTASRKQSHKVKIRGGNILDYLPKEKFVLGLHNGGEIIALAEHLVRKAVNESNFSRVRQLVAEHNLDLKTNLYFTQPDYMVSSYLVTTKKGSLNDDLLIWLIENGAPLPKDCFFSVIICCSDDVIKLVAEKGYTIDNLALRTLMARKSTRYDTLKVCWKSYLKNNNTHTTADGYFFEGLRRKLFKEVTYNIRTLIMMAWKFDQNCLFRQLPKEIILEILSYDYIDEPPYWALLNMVVENFQYPAQTFSSTRDEYLLKVFPLVWKNWDLPSYKVLQKSIVEKIIGVSYNNSRIEDMDNFLIWVLRLLQRITDPPNVEHWRTSRLTLYCLLTESTMTLEIFKLMLEKNLTTQQSLLGCDRYYVPTATPFMPALFLPFIMENKPMIELLIDQSLFQDEVQYHRAIYSLEEILRTHYPDRLHLIKFVEEYRAKRRANKN